MGQVASVQADRTSIAISAGAGCDSPHSARQMESAVVPDLLADGKITAGNDLHAAAEIVILCALAWQPGLANMPRRYATVDY